jgi:D-alanine-D-alanine ligase
MSAKNFHTSFRTKSDISFLSSNGSTHVVLLAGGMSAEREVSLSSAQGVGKALVELGYRVTKLDMGSDFASVIYSLKPDVVYNCLHGTYGEDGCVPGILDIMHIPYTHSGVLSSALAFNKEKSRQVMIGSGIKVAEGRVVLKSEELKEDPIPRPYVIKPLSQGSSVGVEVIFEEDKFNFADYKFEYGNEILVEKYIKGRELQVAVLNGKSLGVLEIVLLKNRFYDYETKYTEGFARHDVPAKIPEEIYNKAMELSEKVNFIFGAEGMVRVEMIYNELDGELYMLELNTHPGMTPLSICPEIAEKVGISYSDIVKQLVESAKFSGDEIFKKAK